VAREEEVTTIVVGLPLTLTGGRGPAARGAEAEVEALRTLAPDLEVLLWDERMTTAIAERTLLEGDVRRRDRKQVIDKIAAAVMLQGWLDAQR
jgi:putative Holliday junction resolvase